jgi:hypothetical protein
MAAAKRAPAASPKAPANLRDRVVAQAVECLGQPSGVGTASATWCEVTLARAGCYVNAGAVRAGLEQHEAPEDAQAGDLVYLGGLDSTHALVLERVGDGEALRFTIAHPNVAGIVIERRVPVGEVLEARSVEPLDAAGAVGADA